MWWSKSLTEPRTKKIKPERAQVAKDISNCTAHHDVLLRHLRRNQQIALADPEMCMARNASSYSWTVRWRVTHQLLPGRIAGGLIIA